MERNKTDDLTRIIALWEVKDESGNSKKDRNGNKYYTGTLGGKGGARVLMFFNSNKRSESSPDATISVKPFSKEFSDKGSDNTSPSQEKDFEDNDIPF